MEVAVNHVIAIAEKITRMEVLGEDSVGLNMYKNNSVVFDKKNRNHYFYIQYDKTTKLAQVVIFVNSSMTQEMNIKVHFLKVAGYDIASRLEIVGKEKITDEEVKTNYITLPHFITLKDSIMLMLQK